MRYKSEKALLAAIVRNPEVYWEVRNFLSPEILPETWQTFKEIAIAIEDGLPMPRVEGEPHRPFALPSKFA